MHEILLWCVSAFLLALFVAANVSNARLLLGHYRREDGSNPSPILLAGGIAGAIAFSIAPNETLRAYFWVPLVLDLGTGPYLLLAAVMFTVAAFSATSEKDADSAPEAATADEPPSKARAIVGCILGTAVGDALGLACEGLSRERQLRMFPELSGYKLLPFGKGMCSDDTEHTCMLAQSLIETAHFRNWSTEEFSGRFASNFAWRLRFWLLGLPAGIGMATLRAILKLWIGFPARWSGIYSAGNAPAMRIALVGVCYGEDIPLLRSLVRAATRVTHTDPKAEHAALAVALAAHLSATRIGPISPDDFLAALTPLCGNEAEFMTLMRSVAASAGRGESAESFAASIGCGTGVTGYIYHTVPVALHVWLRRQSDYRAALIETVRLGGDTDTVGAIVGALVGAGGGKEGVPDEWLRDLWEWPRTPAWMEALGVRLAEQCRRSINAAPLPLSGFKLLVRNALFLLLVLGHGFRRLLPPY
jgi:ADP-ribosylglycohydrolase